MASTTNIGAASLAESAALLGVTETPATTTTTVSAAQPAIGAPAKDRWRAWLWWLLAILAASQSYFVRELFAAFGLFALAFVAIAALVVTVYMLQKSWELAVARVASLRQPVLQISPVPDDTRKPA